jgi:small subunit ribosomal protein S19
MSRSFFKGPFFNRKLNQVIFDNNNRTKPIKITNKNTTILPEYINQTFLVYNGVKWILFPVKNNMINYKFGEFISTRSQFQFKKKKK